MIYLVTGQNQLFDNETYKIISVKESLRLLEPLTIVGLDTETEGFSPFLKRLLTLQLGNRDFQIVVDCTTVDVKLYKEYLESDRLFIGWNLKFDVKFLFYHGIIPRNLYDGYLAEKMRWLGWPSGMHSLSLKSAGENYLGVELDKTVRGQIIWKKELTDEIVEYAANDVRYLEDIMNAQTAILYERGQKLALEIENKAILPTAYFEFCGVKLSDELWTAKMKKDEIELQAAQGELDKFIIELYEQGAEEINKFIEIAQPDLFGLTKAGPKCKVNWNSSKQVIPLLEFFGFDLMTRDKVKGGMKKSVDATVIEGQKDKHPIAKVYLRFKAAQKVVSTYGQNFKDLVNPVTGRIHSQFNQIGTDTHRYSSGGGDDKEVIPGRKVPLVNLQNLPADAETRACFVAEKGNKWISIDFCSEESVILANIAKDKAMLDIFRNKGDLHSLVAKMVYPEELRNIDVKDVKKLRPDLRKAAKKPEFTFAYGGDANTLIGRDHIPEDEARKIEANYRKGFKGVDAYQSRQRKLVMQLGYIDECPEVGFRAHIYDFDKLSATQSKFCKEFWDRYRVLKASNPDCDEVVEVRQYFKRKSASERQSINYPIQARASAIYKIAMVNFFKWVVDNNLFGIVKFCIPCHDETNLEAPEDIAEEVAAKLHECMVKAGKFICRIVPLEAEVSRLKDGTLPTYWVH